MSDTPRSDAHNWNEGHYDDPLHSLLDFARQLERELNAANDRIKQLENAGNGLSMWVCPEYKSDPANIALREWIKAKEAKP